MAVISMKQLLEAGVHFGHQTRRWNPKMDKYIYTSRSGIHIIDLQKTVVLVEEAYQKLLEICISRSSWERNHIANIRHTCTELHQPFKTQSKTSMWHGSITP